MNAIPHISFTMDTRKGAHQPASSSLSEGMALGVWEKISSSIRLRPTELPKAAGLWKRGGDLQPSFKAKERTSWSLVEQRTRDDRWGNS